MSHARAVRARFALRIGIETEKGDAVVPVFTARDRAASPIARQLSDQAAHARQPRDQQESPGARTSAGTWEDTGRAAAPAGSERSTPQ